MDWIHFNHHIHGLVAPEANIRAAPPLLYDDLYTQRSAPMCRLSNPTWFTVYTLVICRSVAPVWSPQTRFCQLYQMSACCHGDGKWAGSDFVFLGDKHRDSYQVRARAEKHHEIQARLMGELNTVMAAEIKKALPLSSILLIPERFSSPNGTASWAEGKRRENILTLSGYSPCSV